MRDTFLAWREQVLRTLGGLPAPEVKNEEWLYLLKKETRNSIMVEGIFVKEEDLESILFAGNYEIRNSNDVLNYFKTARFLYGLGFENHINEELILSQGLIRQINKGVMENRVKDPGKYRKGKVMIKGAEIQPPEFDLDRWLKLYIEWVLENFKRLPFLRFAALQHSLFEALHPFEDGNGRTGRILTNYFFVSRGFSIVMIKGDDPSRDTYYNALQEADLYYNEFFKGEPDYKKLSSILEKTPTESLEEIFFRGLRESMDLLIISIMEQNGEKMMTSEKLAEIIGYSKDSIRKLVERGKLIAVRRGNTYFSHPILFYRE
ncbi:MAG: Fic family protein [Candidatus Omnitrophota bacterium]